MSLIRLTYGVCASILAVGLLSTTVVCANTLTATQTCEATKKLRSDNPGAVRLVVGEPYVLLAENRQPPTHYQIKIPGAPVTDRRWVAIDCGVVSDKDVVDRPAAVAENLIPMDSIENVLAASWQTTFCATKAGKTKIECQTQNNRMPHATQFSIHGLWPDDLDDRKIFPCYCDSGQPKSCRTKQKRDESIQIENDIWDKLQTLMPGVQSGLHLHEWTKHGSCYEDFITGDGKGADATEYFSDTVLLIEQLNASTVVDLFRSRLGQTIELSELRQTFDKEFGAGAGDRVFMNCSSIDGATYIAELWIGLSGEINPSSQLGELMLAAPPTTVSTNRKSCQRGKVFAL